MSDKVRCTEERIKNCVDQGKLCKENPQRATCIEEDKALKLKDVVIDYDLGVVASSDKIETLRSVLHQLIAESEKRKLLKEEAVNRPIQEKHRIEEVKEPSKTSFMGSKSPEREKKSSPRKESPKSPSRVSPFQVLDQIESYKKNDLEKLAEKYNINLTYEEGDKKGKKKLKLDLYKNIERVLREKQEGGEHVLTRVPSRRLSPEPIGELRPLKEYKRNDLVRIADGMGISEKRSPGKKGNRSMPELYEKIKRKMESPNDKNKEEIKVDLSSEKEKLEFLPLLPAEFISKRRSRSVSPPVSPKLSPPREKSRDVNEIERQRIIEEEIKSPFVPPQKSYSIRDLFPPGEKRSKSPDLSPRKSPPRRVLQDRDEESEDELDKLMKSIDELENEEEERESSPISKAYSPPPSPKYSSPKLSDVVELKNQKARQDKPKIEDQLEKELAPPSHKAELKKKNVELRDKINKCLGLI